MVVNKNNFNWNNIAKKGEVNERLKEALNILKSNLIDKIITQGETPFINNSNIFKNEFKEYLISRFDEVFIRYNKFLESERDIKANQFLLILKDYFNLIFNQKAACVIEFDGYNIYKFFKVLSSLLENIEIKIQREKLYILTMDSKSTVIFEIHLKNDKLKFFKEINIGINLNDLKKALQCKISDKSRTKFIFSTEKLFITIESQEYQSQIERSLNYTEDLKPRKIFINKLQSIKYPCYIKISKEKLNYLLENLGIHSKMVKIRCSHKRVSFIESGKVGGSKIIWNKSNIKKIDLDINILKENLNIITEINCNNRSISQIQQINELEKEIDKIDTKKYIECLISLVFFKVNRKIASILDKKDCIKLFFKENYPLKSEVSFPKLGDVSIIMYIPPRE